MLVCVCVYVPAQSTPRVDERVLGMHDDRHTSQRGYVLVPRHANPNTTPFHRLPKHHPVPPTTQTPPRSNDYPNTKPPSSSSSSSSS
jgi:hypothetical protein